MDEDTKKLVIHKKDQVDSFRTQITQKKVLQVPRGQIPEALSILKIF